MCWKRNGAQCEVLKLSYLVLLRPDVNALPVEGEDSDYEALPFMRAAVELICFEDLARSSADFHHQNAQIGNNLRDMCCRQFHATGPRRPHIRCIHLW